MSDPATSIELKLERALSDPKVNDPAFQSEIEEAKTSMKSGGIAYSQRGMMFDGGGALGYPLADFTIQMTQILAPAIASVLTAWVVKKSGRKFKVKIGSDYVEGKDATEVGPIVDKLIAHLQKVSKKTSK